MPARKYPSSYKAGPGRGTRITGYMKASKNRRSDSVQSAREASFVSAVSRVVNNRPGNKKFVTEQVENIQLSHNAGGTGLVACLNATGRPANICATSSNSFQNGRIGDMIRGKGASIKLWLSNKLDRPNVMYRVIVLQWYHGFDPTTATNIWRANASPNVMLASVDFDKFRVRYDRSFPVGSGVSHSAVGTALVPSPNFVGKEHSRLVKFWIGTPGTIKYQTDNGQVPSVEKYCLALYVLAYDAKGTLTTDQIASCAYKITYNFADP